MTHPHKDLIIQLMDDPTLEVEWFDDYDAEWHPCEGPLANMVNYPSVRHRLREKPKPDVVRYVDAAEIERLQSCGNGAGCLHKDAVIELQAAEIGRLKSCLKQANSNHERFEREWYLRGDELDKANALLRRALEALEAAIGSHAGWFNSTKNAIAAIKTHLGDV